MTREQEVESPEQPGQDKPPDQYGRAMPVLGIAVGIGLVTIIAYASQSSLQGFLSVVAGGWLVGGASLVVGCFVGFLFGIPRTVQKMKSKSGQPPSAENEKAEKISDETTVILPYEPNTNLEEISDWLTKILVGVGLTQLSTIPARFQATGQLLAPALGNFAHSDVFALITCIYFALCGFFASFLWTRLTLPTLQVRAARDALNALLDAARKQGEKHGKETGVKKATETFAPYVKTQEGSVEQDALWVDDMPENNYSEQELLRRLCRLKFTNVLSTEAAIASIKPDLHKYCLVISDMRRPGDPRAGYTLLDKLRAMKYDKPYIIYSSSGRPERDAEARDRGAEGSANNPDKLVELVRNALARVNVAHTA